MTTRWKVGVHPSSKEALCSFVTGINHTIARYYENYSSHYFSGKSGVAIGKAPWKSPSGTEENTHSSTGDSYGATLRVGRRKEFSLVDLQKTIFLHREDQTIQFSRKFYLS